MQGPVSAMPGHAYSIPHELPSSAEKFFGRRDELTKLTKLTKLTDRLCGAQARHAGVPVTALAADH